MTDAQTDRQVAPNLIVSTQIIRAFLTELRAQGGGPSRYRVEMASLAVAATGVPLPPGGG